MDDIDFIKILIDVNLTLTKEFFWDGNRLLNEAYYAMDKLDYKVDEKKLREVFWLAGKVQRVDLSIDKEGKSRGFGVVEFSHPVESVQAISMFHNQDLYDRQMTVRMDRFSEQPKLPEGLKSIGPGLGDNGAPMKDVAFNLQNQNNQPVGQGILGAVPNIPMAALNNLSSVGNLNPTAVLQAANLAGVGGLSGSLISNDLGLANLVQNQSLAALASTNLNGSGNGNFGGRTDNFNTSSNRGFGNFGAQKMTTTSFGNVGGFSRDDSNSYSANTSSMMTMRNSGPSQQIEMKYGSQRILMQNLPPSANFKMISDKCGEFGEVKNIENKGNGSYIVTYASEWDGERAIKNLDRARIDGRIINVRTY